MRHVMRLLAACLALAGLAVMVNLATASASVGTSSIYSAGASKCVAATEGATLGSPVILAPCNPNDPYQHWAFNPTGAFHLVGTNMYIVSSTSGTLLGLEGRATDFTYVNHQLAADGYWLTVPGDTGEPFLAPDGPPGSQAFYVFTSYRK